MVNDCPTPQGKGQAKKERDQGHGMPQRGHPMEDGDTYKTLKTLLMVRCAAEVATILSLRGSQQ